MKPKASWPSRTKSSTLSTHLSKRPRKASSVALIRMQVRITFQPRHSSSRISRSSSFFDFSKKSSKRFIISMRKYCTARERQFWPFESRAEILAPARSKCLQISSFPFLVAMASAVSPIPFRCSKFAPYFRCSSTPARFPSSAASCRRDFPEKLAALIFADED